MSSAESKYLKSSNNSNNHPNLHCSLLGDKSLPFVPDVRCGSSGQTGLNSKTYFNLPNNIPFRIRLKLIKDKYLLEHLAQRLENCKDTGFFAQVCWDCKKIKSITKLTCMSPFCSDKICIDMRVKQAEGYLEDLHIKSKKLMHMSIGFKPIKRLTKEHKKIQTKTLNLFCKEMQKLGSPLKMICIKDLSKRNNKRIYFHYHLAILPYMKFSFRKF